jgi:hypothetical protein
MIIAFHLCLNCTSTNNNRLKNGKGSKNYEEFHFSNLYPMRLFFTNELHKYLHELIWQNVAGTSVFHDAATPLRETKTPEAYFCVRRF